MIPISGLISEKYRIDYFMNKLREDIEICSSESVSDATGALSIIKLSFDNDDLSADQYNVLAHEIHSLARSFMLKCDCSKVH